MVTEPVVQMLLDAKQLERSLADPKPKLANGSEPTAEVFEASDPQALQA